MEQTLLQILFIYRYTLEGMSKMRSGGLMCAELETSFRTTGFSSRGTVLSHRKWHDSTEWQERGIDGGRERDWRIDRDGGRGKERKRQESSAAVPLRIQWKTCCREQDEWVQSELVQVLHCVRKTGARTQRDKNRGREYHQSAEGAIVSEGRGAGWQKGREEGGRSVHNTKPSAALRWWTHWSDWRREPTQRRNGAAGTQPQPGRRPLTDQHLEWDAVVAPGSWPPQAADSGGYAAGDEDGGGGGQRLLRTGLQALGRFFRRLPKSRSWSEGLRMLRRSSSSGTLMLSGNLSQRDNKYVDRGWDRMGFGLESQCETRL